ncbi:28S ribosomal protein S22, mitochondrial isoform X1 [Engraulis encrasicolus]|uniref:28S ribosomal protein S22, mitochondrial isoform X1 n=1 Tax=Engraulis encrasicolus TaxID=184585 RepID=UPI002FD50D21
MAAHGAFRLLRVSASVTNTHLVARAFPSALSGRCLCSAAARGHVGFSDPEVQRLLKVMTGCDLQKVFKVTPQPTLKPPSYKLLTDQQLQQAVSAAEEEAGHLLTPPPELEERVAINDELSHDALLEGADEAKLVFTDITLNVPHRERFMVVREPSGSLRKASWEERDRILQIYFPKEGRQLTHPAIFNQESMKLALSEGRHEEILKRNLVQFEPDSAEYKRVCVQVYEDVERNGSYDLLRSTRFFAGLVWFLGNNKRIDALLLDMLQRDLLEDAVCLVRLFLLLHPNSQSATRADTHTTGLELLKVYCECDCQKRSLMELALQTHQQAEALSSH